MRTINNAKKANTKQAMNTTKKEVKVSPKETSKAKAKTEKKQSEYSLKVLVPYKELKKESKTVGGARAILLTFAEKLDSKVVQYLRESKKNQAIYEQMNKEVRRSKNGNVSPFYVLQYVYKQLKK